MQNLTLIQTLRNLIYSTGKMNHSEWSGYLIVSPNLISAWFDGSGVLTTQDFFKILSYLRGFEDEETKNALDDFYAMADRPIAEVLEPGQHPSRYKNFSTIGDFILSEVFPKNLEFNLTKVPFKYRLQTIALLGRVVDAIAGIITITPESFTPDALETIKTEEIKKFFKTNLIDK